MGFQLPGSSRRSDRGSRSRSSDCRPPGTVRCCKVPRPGRPGQRPTPPGTPGYRRESARPSRRGSPRRWTRRGPAERRRRGPRNVPRTHPKRVPLPWSPSVSVCLSLLLSVTATISPAHRNHGPFSPPSTPADLLTSGAVGVLLRGPRLWSDRMSVPPPPPPPMSSPAACVLWITAGGSSCGGFAASRLPKLALRRPRAREHAPRTPRPLLCGLPAACVASRPPHFCRACVHAGALLPPSPSPLLPVSSRTHARSHPRDEFKSARAQSQMCARAYLLRRGAQVALNKFIGCEMYGQDFRFYSFI